MTVGLREEAGTDVERERDDGRRQERLHREDDGALAVGALAAFRRRLPPLSGSADVVDARHREADAEPRPRLEDAEEADEQRRDGGEQPRGVGVDGRDSDDEQCGDGEPGDAGQVAFASLRVADVARARLVRWHTWVLGPGQYLCIGGLNHDEMAGSRSVVLAALFANGAIAVLKFLAFLVTGSPAMLSEVYHSVSDTGNQVFLLVGLRYGERDRTRSHPFGYGKAQFFYSCLVSVMLFGIAGWESATHGFEALTGHGRVLGRQANLLGYEFPGVWASYAVLLGAIGFETYAFVKAYEEMQRQIERHGWSGFREAFRRTSDTTTLTALTEDTVALLGLVFALVGIFLTEQTGNHVYDAAAALLIGVLLMAFAVALAWENKRLLLGESLPAADENDLRRIVEERPEVDSIVGFRTVYFGPNEVLVTADVAFDPALDTGEMDDVISSLEDALRAANPAVSKVYVEPETDR